MKNKKAFYVVLSLILVIAMSTTAFATDNTYFCTDSGEIVIEFVDGKVVELENGVTISFSIREEEPSDVTPFLIHLGRHELSWTRREILSDFPIFRTALHINNVSWNPPGTIMEGAIQLGGSAFPLNVRAIPVNGWTTVTGIPSFQTWRLQMWLHSDSTVGPGRFYIYVHDTAE